MQPLAGKVSLGGRRGFGAGGRAEEGRAGRRRSRPATRAGGSLNFSFGVGGEFLSQSGAVAAREKKGRKEGTRKGNKRERGRGDAAASPPASVQGAEVKVLRRRRPSLSPPLAGRSRQTSAPGRGRGGGGGAGAGAAGPRRSPRAPRASTAPRPLLV